MNYQNFGQVLGRFTRIENKNANKQKTEKKKEGKTLLASERYNGYVQSLRTRVRQENGSGGFHKHDFRTRSRGSS